MMKANWLIEELTERDSMCVEYTMYIHSHRRYPIWLSVDLSVD